MGRVDRRSAGSGRSLNARYGATGKLSMTMLRRSTDATDSGTLPWGHQAAYQPSAIVALPRSSRRS